VEQKERRMGEVRGEKSRLSDQMGSDLSICGKVGGSRRTVLPRTHDGREMAIIRARDMTSALPNY